jgi:hypothetical protein
MPFLTLSSVPYRTEHHCMGREEEGVLGIIRLNFCLDTFMPQAPKVSISHLYSRHFKQELKM